MQKLFSLLLLFAAVAFGYETCGGGAQDSYQLTCLACSDVKTSSINFVKDMPRMDFKGKKVNSCMAV